MDVKNKYVTSSHISEAKFREIIKYFSEDLNATQISNSTNISRPTINKYLKAIRTRIVEYCNIDSPLSKEAEVDESYLKDRSIKSQIGRGRSGKTIVFGLLKREGKIYTEIVPDAKKALMQAIIRGKVGIDSVTHSEGWRGYHGLVDIRHNKYFRIHQGEHSQINEIESFWSYAKIRLAKFRGINKENFNLHLKESEYRFNHRGEDLYKQLLKIFRKNPIKLS
ncbi:MAG: IS1595 family transposase [Campylobacterales bacterium]|nr:IS1595 family transposase [Campylobacterales bacterium]HEO98186.1 IS1595 family transposase [Campylobacterota bacterium]